jgi:riboflavin synthase alpha subunit
MFSGIIEEVGTVESYDGETLVVRANQVLDDLKISESIMVAGACLTVTR